MSIIIFQFEFIENNGFHSLRKMKTQTSQAKYNQSLCWKIIIFPFNGNIE